MARDQIDMTPLQSRDELVRGWRRAFVRSRNSASAPNMKRRRLRWRVTTPFRMKARAASARCWKACSSARLEPITENGKIIGLYDVTGGGAISLEPGGQFELSGAPVETVHQTSSELMAHLAQVREIATPLGIGFLALGMTPSWSREQIPVMPKGRYKHHDELHAQGRQVRSRHDVSHLHRCRPISTSRRKPTWSRAARVRRAAASGDCIVCEFSVHRRQAERLPVVSRRDLA